jgi:hypothetical protein
MHASPLTTDAHCCHRQTFAPRQQDRADRPNERGGRKQRRALVFVVLHESGYGPILPTCAVQQVGSFLRYTRPPPVTRQQWPEVRTSPSRSLVAFMLRVDVPAARQTVRAGLKITIAHLRDRMRPHPIVRHCKITTFTSPLLGTTFCGNSRNVEDRCAAVVL